MNKSVLGAFLLLSCSLWAQERSEGPPSGSELAEIGARGRALAGYDAAAWHATDALLALKPSEGLVRLYVARKTDKGWAVAFGRFDEAKTKLLVAYEAQQAGEFDEYTVTKHEPPLENQDFYFHAAKAFALAKEEFLNSERPQRQYNISILPAPSGEWYCYAIPAQTDLSVLPFGGDVRFTISSDGTKVVEKRQMHKIVLEEQVGNGSEFGYHTHVLSDLPEDSDVFYALSRKAKQGDLIATKKYFFQALPNGSLTYLGKTAEIQKLIEEDKFETLPGLAKSPAVKTMFTSSIRRLLEDVSSGSPLEAYATLSGVRCDKQTVWLKFSQSLHNIGEGRIILYKEPLLNSQARFGATEADVQAGKFEKVAFFTPKKPDFADRDSFFVLSPGRSYSEDHEYPILDLDLRGKGAIQFLFFTWPLGSEKEAEPQRVRWHDAGYLYTDSIATIPMRLEIDPKLLQNCLPK